MADLPYRIVIGLEVHVQLLTKTKLFCGCSTQFGLPPNSATCPICIGMPGVLPVMNRRAFELGLKAALALECQIAASTKWDRKNYYYPDLPKNYQISQYDLPFSHDGWIEIDTPAGSKTPTGTKRVGIIRAHLEEDAGKMLHDDKGGGGNSLVDLNRAGTPLLEIVSKPDMSSPEEAKAYLDELKLLLFELGISDCEMQEGSLRCDANVNIHIPLEDGSFAATPIVEVKNMNSFGGVQRAMAYEAERQFEDYQKNIGKTWELMPGAEMTIGYYPKAVYRRCGSKRNGQLKAIPKETRGWNDPKGVTVLQRVKEDVSDYRYFPEPDLVPVAVEKDTLERVRDSLGELPAAQRKRLQSQYGLSHYDAQVLTSRGRAVVDYFEKVTAACGDAKAASNWITNKLLATFKQQSQLDAGPFAIESSDLAGLITEQKAMPLTKQVAEQVFDLMVAEGVNAKEAIKRMGIKPGVDKAELVAIVRRAIAANPKAVADFKKGKTTAAQSIKGPIMRETKGTVKPDLVEQILMEELAKA
jgi:aspartyl-tRNA(Asn)/glutamyl-tRNA(Gln) amidotransferase subunit B